MGRGLYYRGGKNERTSFGCHWIRSVTSCNKDAKMSHFTFHVNLEILASAFHICKEVRKSESHFTLKSHLEDMLRDK